MNSLPQRDPFDEGALLAMLSGDRELAQTIVRSAMDDIPNYFDSLEQAVLAGNRKEAERLTHTLKGLVAQIGGVHLSSRLKEVNGLLRAGGEVSGTTVTELRREYAALVVALQEWTN